jgi:predicted NAD-dependent protein-ADP-ribosyltransferase YbiA (DUF1768 family)
MIRKYKVKVSMRCYWNFDDIEFDDDEFVNLEHYLRSEEFEMCEDPDDYANFQIDEEEEIK